MKNKQKTIQIVDYDDYKNICCDDRKEYKQHSLITEIIYYFQQTTM